MGHPKNIRAISPGSDPEAHWPISHNIIYLGVYDEDIVGLFILHPQSEIVVKGHVAMHPDHYDKTDGAYQAGFRWILNNTSFMKIVGETPVFNKLAIKCNERNGFVREGINTKSYMRHGKLYDQIYFGREL